jgi:hypothetical protein
MALKPFALILCLPVAERHVSNNKELNRLRQSGLTSPEWTELVQTGFNWCRLD